MRIVFICRRYCPGEAWTNRILAYAKGFLKHGVEVCILYLISDKNKTPYQIDIPNIKVINLWETDGMLARRYRPLSYIRNVLRIGRFVQNNDICFLTDASGLYVNQLRFVRKKIKIVCEVTEHPSVLSGGKSLLTWFRTYKIKKVDKIFVISRALKEYFIDLGVNDNQIHIVNMFVDMTRFDGIKKCSSDKYIAYCGNVSKDKDGVDMLIEAFAIFHKSYPEYTLEIYGRSVGNTIEELKKLAKELDIENKVIFTGMIDASAIPQKLVNATVLALCRPENLQNKNGFPTKLGEYLMSGNPVVVTAVGEIPFYIKDGYNAYLVEPGNVTGFADKLLRAVSEIDKHPEIPTNGQILAKTEFSYIEQTKKALRYIYGD